jgi:peptidoglycan hydrolase-like protein with peptidoglycan-binding domain
MVRAAIVAVAIAPGLFFCNPAARGDEQMRRAQEELRKRNLYFGDIDGRQTPETAAAIHEYQRRKGFGATGEIDTVTADSLKLPAGNLPDAPVLRSDVALTKSEREKLKAQPAPAAPATLGAGGPVEAASDPVGPLDKPPPESKRAPREQEKQATEIVAEYLGDLQSNVPARELRHYAKQVDYLHHGAVKRTSIEAQARTYQRLWPRREYRLIAAKAYVSRSHPDEVTVKYRVAFTVSNPRTCRIARGVTLNSVTLHLVDGRMEIVAVKEQRPPRPHGFFCGLGEGFRRLGGCD